jgi:hypothetical protein
VARFFAARSPATTASDENDSGLPGAGARLVGEGGAARPPLYRAVDRGRALGADAALTEEPRAAMRTSRAGSTLEAAAIETAVAFNTVVPAE